MGKRIIFLGAGASAAEGAPVQSKLFKEYFNHCLVNGISIDEHLTKYFKSFWNIDITRGNINNILFPTFEEALGILELAKQRQEGFKGYYSTANSNSIDHTIEDLILLISQVLEWKLQNNNKYHTELVNKLIDLGYYTETSFISLNYDILIDNAITLRVDAVDLDYGIDLMNYKFEHAWYPPDVSRSIKLLKIHGSLNWLYCPICKKVEITPKEKGVTQLLDRNNSRKRCRLCDGRYSPILIPPTYFKVMSNPYLIQIWNHAEDLLRECEEIVFCGYSMPDADIHVKYLIKRGLVNRGIAQPRIVIVNNYKNKPQELIDEEKERYNRLFCINIDYTDLSFEDFSKNPKLIFDS